MTTVSPFFFSQSRFRRILLVLIFLLLVAYIYVAIFGQVQLDEQLVGRFRESFRDTFQRAPNRQRSLDRQDGQGSFKSKFTTATTTATTDQKSTSRTGDGPTDEELSQEKFEPGMELMRRMMKHAWDGYRNYAWGQDELRPISKGAMGFIGEHSMLLTIVDAIDTLMIMHMDKEYVEARDLLLERLSFDFPMTVSMFETNIRILGGLLSAFALSGDSRYVTKAFDLAQRFMAAFEDGVVFPHNRLHLLAHVDPTMKSKVDNDPNRVVFLAEIGTFSLEFGYLSDILNDPTYVTKALNIIERMEAMKTSAKGLFPASIYPNREVQPDDYYSLGGQCDSFYEYLLKYWLYTGKRSESHERLYRAAVDGIKRNLLQRRQGRWFVVNMKNERVLEEQEHLACFAPGMLALGARAMGDEETFQLAESLTESCYLMYHKQKIGLSPEFININTFRPSQHNKAYWTMRPEVVESLFVLWRLTGNPRYRRWGYEIAQNIEKWARVETGGYSGIENILVDPPKMNDHQESFFLAETIKYLYLLFSPNDVLPLDEWVFNTEAHPFPINWRGTPMSSSPIKTGTSKQSGGATGESTTGNKTDTTIAVDNITRPA